MSYGTVAPTHPIKASGAGSRQPLDPMSGQRPPLRTFGVDARRWVRWILNPSRRSFKLRVLVNRQRPMKNVTFDRATVLQLDANGTDSALDAAADCHVLRNDAALDMCAIADQEIRGAQLAFGSAEDLRWTFAFDVADDRHVGADTRGRSRFFVGSDLAQAWSCARTRRGDNARDLLFSLRRRLQIQTQPGIEAAQAASVSRG